MKLINLTPHPFRLMNEQDSTLLELPKAANPPRVSEERNHVGTLTINSTAVRVNSLTLGNVKNLPEPQPETGYIVSRIVAEACPSRNDLYIPDETVRDEAGRIIGCQALAQV